jgi:hypothetical protein
MLSRTPTGGRPAASGAARRSRGVAIVMKAVSVEPYRLCRTDRSSAAPPLAITRSLLCRARRDTLGRAVIRLSIVGTAMSAVQCSSRTLIRVCSASKHNRGAHQMRDSGLEHSPTVKRRRTHQHPIGAAKRDLLQCAQRNDGAPAERPRQRAASPAARPSCGKAARACTASVRIQPTTACPQVALSQLQSRDTSNGRCHR